MKIKLIGLILVALFLLVLGTTKTIFVSNKQRSDTIYLRELDSLAGRAQKAKALGKKRVIFPAPIPIYAHVPALKEALSTFKAVRAQLIKEKSYAMTPDEIVTWYKFAITEVISPDDATETSRPESDLPFDVVDQDLLPVKEDEVLIPQPGGTLVIDGITLVQESDNTVSLIPSQEYLLFLSKRFSGRAGIIEMGPFGIFLIKSGDVLEPVFDRETFLRRDIEMLHGRSLSHLKASIAHSNSQE